MKSKKNPPSAPPATCPSASDASLAPPPSAPPAPPAPAPGTAHASAVLDAAPSVPLVDRAATGASNRYQSRDTKLLRLLRVYRRDVYPECSRLLLGSPGETSADAVERPSDAGLVEIRKRGIPGGREA